LAVLVLAGHGLLRHGLSWSGTLHSCSLGGATLIVTTEVAVLAESLRIVGFASVRASPGLLGAAAAVIAVSAHALGVVLAVSVRTVGDRLLGQFVVRPWDASNFIASFRRLFFVKNMA